MKRVDELNDFPFIFSEEATLRVRVIGCGFELPFSYSSFICEFNRVGMMILLV